jgi:hypothetical protein
MIFLGAMMMSHFHTSLKFGALALAAALAACGGGGGGGDAVSSPVAVSLAQVAATASAGDSFLVSGTAVSQPNLMTSAKWTVTKLTAGAPDLSVANADCATATKSGHTTNSLSQSTWKCDAVVTVPATVPQDSTYRFIFNGADEKGNASSDFRDVTVVAAKAPAVATPTASAQAALTVTSGDNVGLNCFAAGGKIGAGSSYRIQWVVKSNASGLPINFDANAAGALTFKAPAVNAPSSVTFQCRVTDDNLATGTADSVVTINPSPLGATNAVAVAGPAQSVLPQALVTLDGSQSTIQGGGALYFTWTQTEGPVVGLAGAATAKPTFVAPVVTQNTRLVFRMTAQATPNNAANASVSETTEAVVYVNPLASLTLSISPAQATSSGRAVVLTINAIPASGTLYYEWTQVSGPVVTLGGANTSSASFVTPKVAASTEMLFSVKVSRTPIAQADPNEIATTDVVVSVGP